MQAFIYLISWPLSHRLHKMDMCGPQRSFGLVFKVGLVSLLLMMILAEMHLELFSALPPSRKSRKVILRRRRQSALPNTSMAATHSNNSNHDVTCHVGIPCRYPDIIDFRIIVMASNRSDSLRELLQSLQYLELDGDTSALEIWVDKPMHGEAERTLQTARKFRWRHGVTRLHVRKQKAGSTSQLIDTWRSPRNRSELALILQEDLIISPYAYRWLKAAHRAYGHRADIAGYTLYSEDMNSAINQMPISVSDREVAFLYQPHGSYGFSPHPTRWRRFQKWYHKRRKTPSRGYRVPVENVTLRSWHQRDIDWNLRYTYYNKLKNLYTVYSNLNQYNQNNKSCLAVQEGKVGTMPSNLSCVSGDCLLRTWDPLFVRFPGNPVMIDISGSVTRPDVNPIRKPRKGVHGKL